MREILEFIEKYEDGCLELKKSDKNIWELTLFHTIMGRRVKSCFDITKEYSSSLKDFISMIDIHIQAEIERFKDNPSCLIS